jgi:cell fate (sporulation/competence/biofilm development) regulator YlbF (YheA/YmcA/DUF963 family)
MSGNPEILNGSAESTVEAQDAAAERKAELAKNLENSVEQSPEARAEELEHARVEANKEALMSKERGGGEKKTGGEPTSSAVRKITKKQKDAEYKKTMTAIRSEMSAPSRAFSKVIHNPVIEKTSEVVGSTVARPNAILAGSITAFLSVSLIYIVAKQYGYVLSGFESIGAFIIGWLIGISFDYIRLLIRGSTK